MPDVLPDRLEAGTLNGPGLAGLEAGLAYVRERGVDAIHAHESRLKARLRSGLEAMAGVRVLSPAAPDGVGIVTFTVDGMSPGMVAHLLDQDWGIQGRAGRHCAPGCHALLGSSELGAMRLSVGWASTEEDVDRALEAVEAVAGGARGGWRSQRNEGGT